MPKPTTPEEWAAHYDLDIDRPRGDQSINWDAQLYPGTVDPASVKAWRVSQYRIGDAFVGVTHLLTNIHYCYPSFVYDGTTKRYSNGKSASLTKVQLGEIYGNHYITVDRHIKVLGGGPSALGQRSGIQHKIAAQRAGIGAEPAFWMGWSILGTANPATPQEIRFVSGRNPGKFRDRRNSVDRDGFDPRDIPRRWRKWITDDLVRDLALRARRSSIGRGHDGQPRAIEIMGEVRIGWITQDCNLRNRGTHAVSRGLVANQRVLVTDHTAGNRFSTASIGRWRRSHLWVKVESDRGDIDAEGWVREDRVTITSRRPT